MTYPLTNQDNCGQEYWTSKLLPCVVAFLRSCLFHFVIKKNTFNRVCACVLVLECYSSFTCNRQDKCGIQDHKILCRQADLLLCEEICFKKNANTIGQGLVLLEGGLTVTAVTAKTFHSEHDMYKLQIILLRPWNLFLCGLLWDLKVVFPHTFTVNL